MEIKSETEIIERGFLGAILMNPSNMDLLINVNREWFTSNGRALIFNSMKDLYGAGRTIDAITIRSKIADSKVEYKNETIKNVYDMLKDEDINPANFISYQESLEEKFLQRTMSLSLKTSISKVQDAEMGAIKDVIDEVESDLFKVSQSSESFSTTIRLGNVGIDYMKKLKKIRESGLPPFVAETGLRDIDKLIGGFSEGEFILLAARPSMGKTALALQIARNNIAKGRAVGFISLEMSQEAIFLRQLSSTSKINSMRIRSGQITKVEFDYLASVWSDMNAEPFYIDDKAPLNETSLRGIARRMVSLFDVEFLIVDYLQLMDSSRGKESRQQEISVISRAFKNLSKELNIPIMALSQLSRAVESRNPPRPMMSDLRESGSLEQDADVVIFIYRPEYYNIDSFPDGSPTTGLAEIIVSKARNAETGSTNTVFIKDTGRFENLAKENIN